MAEPHVCMNLACRYYGQKRCRCYPWMRRAFWIGFWDGLTCLKYCVWPFAFTRLLWLCWSRSGKGP